MTDSGASNPKVLHLLKVFLWIGLTGFGGTLATMTLMEQEWVSRRKLLTQKQFLEGMALCYLLPGPTAVLLSIYLGSRMRRTLGGIVCGLAFIAPAILLTFLLSWIYFQFHTIPQVAALFIDLEPVVVAFILAMLFRSSKAALTSLSRWAVALSVGILLIFPVLPQVWNLITLLLLSGLIGMLCMRSYSTTVQSGSLLAVSGVLAFLREATLSLSPGLLILLPLAFVFLKASLVMFGGGVVAIPLFQQELVQTYHWLTPQQFLDGVAIGQLTPGPVTVVATFAGYAVGSWPGAVVATVAMYLPSFVLMLVATPLLLRLRYSSLVQGTLQGILAGALGMMGATALLLSRTAVTNLWQAALALFCLVLLLRWNISPALVILAVALLGLLRLLFAF
ncbi:chromate resistance transporter [Reticulibacter mediterranei]|uniref:Chromate resistance transporter n=1 Tax=Reticulibacter mediterranei TaxID=2778369 RepID=A0A8J3N0X7_9CHLR|nr:chromate efflux transporter [Reticulibacter mediterranei]GHO94659.1 chromate resistance transporter [Reticulibacter mediterranei]